MPTENQETDEINRFICPNCNMNMKIVRVLTCHSTEYYWSCDCMVEAWNNDIYDITEHI